MVVGLSLVGVAAFYVLVTFPEFVGGALPRSLAWLIDQDACRIQRKTDRLEAALARRLAQRPDQ